jgi:hypothetical protein
MPAVVGYNDNVFVNCPFMTSVRSYKIPLEKKFPVERDFKK